MNFIIGIDLRTTNSYVGILRNNENTIKRLIGGNYSDELVQEDIKNCLWKLKEMKMRNRK